MKNLTEILHAGHIGEDRYRHEVVFDADGGQVAEITMPGDTHHAQLFAVAPALLEHLRMGEEIISGLEAEADNAGIDMAEARAWWCKAEAIIAKAENV
jgi:hypothetical protein